MKLSFGVVFFAFLADLFSLFLLSDALGAWWTLIWVLAAMFLGVLVIIDAGDTLKSLGGIFATPSERIAAIKETPWMLLVGILLFVPGLLSDVIALMLWLPNARRRLLKKTPPPTSQSSVYDAPYEDVTQRPNEPHRPVMLEGQWVEKDPPK